MSTVLIVDDDPTNRDLIRKSLRKDDYQCLVAGGGVEALQIMGSQTPDIVILDIMMPGMTGYQVCEAMRQSPLTRDTLVLFLSARTGGGQ